MRHTSLRLLALLSLCLSASSAFAAGKAPLRSFDATAATPAEVAREARGSDPGALFRIVRLRGAAGETLTLDLEAAPLFAADFHLYVDGHDRGRDAAARITFLRGTVEEWPGSSVSLALDGATGAWSGSAVAGDQIYEITVPADVDQRSIADAAMVRQAPVEGLGNALSDVLEPPLGLDREIGPGQSKIIFAPGAEYQASIAIDSDYELFQILGSEERATDYIAGIMAAVSELYFRQLGVSLTVSSLSLYTTPDDPWNAPNPHSGARADVLCEFSRYWQTFRPIGAFPRNGAVFFTGKSSSDIGGQAWRSGLCSYSSPPTSCPFGGYGIVVVSQRQLRDSYVTAHELGHVFGSRHTHCYNPPIDECHSGEGGCFDGPESTPPDGGSVMSYCLPFNLSMGEEGRFGVDSQRVVQVIRSFVDQVGPRCLERTGDPYALAGTTGKGSVSLTWKDPFTTESNWLVEQLLPTGKYKPVKSLPANATGVTLTRLKPGATTFRIRAKFKRDFSDYSNAVTITVF
jgi:metallopeptidase family M12-like protein